MLATPAHIPIGGNMILEVALMDLGWFCLVMSIRSLAPSNLTRKLLTVMAIYVMIEILFHYWMEAFVARYIF